MITSALLETLKSQLEFAARKKFDAIPIDTPDVQAIYDHLCEDQTTREELPPDMLLASTEVITPSCIWYMLMANERTGAPADPVYAVAPTFVIALQKAQQAMSRRYGIKGEACAPEKVKRGPEVVV